jgi:hypothetical protein
MSSKCCSACAYYLSLISFLKDALTSPNSRVFATCIQCRDRKKASDRKRAALQSLDLNIRPAKRVRHSNTCLQPTVQAPVPLILPIELPSLPPNPPADLLLPRALLTA